jgi:hypothetical protein
MFASGEARWLAVTIGGGKEQPRVLLLSVPYALKAADAETVGGLPPSAFQLAAPAAGVSGGSATTLIATSIAPPPVSSNVTTTGGTVNQLPLWTTATNIQSSAVTQTGSGLTAKIGIGTTAPVATLDVKGGEFVRGTFTLPATATATATKGANSQPDLMMASVFNSGTATAVNQKFQLQAEPVNNNTATVSGTLNLLYGSGTSVPAETGLKINNKGQITFATGQTFPGAGTISGVKAGTDLTGGGLTGTVTLNLDTTKVPQLSTANTFVGNQTITGNLSDTGNISATGSITGQTGTFSGNNSTQIVGVTQSGAGTGVAATAAGAGAAVQGKNTASSGIGVLGTSTGAFGFPVGVEGVSSTGYGVEGTTSSSLGAGVFGLSSKAGSPAVVGQNQATTGATVGTEGVAASPGGTGVLGFASSSTGTILGVNGLSFSTSGTGVLGQSPSNALSATGGALRNPDGFGAFGVWGDTTGASEINAGVMGSADDNYAVAALNNSAAKPAVFALNSTTSADANVFLGQLQNINGFAAIGDPGCGALYMAVQLGQFGMSNCNNYTLIGDGNGNTYLNAGDGFSDPVSIAFRINNVSGMTLNNDTSVTIGTLDVTNSLTKPSGSFKIDHPLDPANKYLYHSFVESPDMKNIYDGTTTTDDAGLATVTLPDWFEALNRDFRYQLTVIGQFAQAIVASEISHNQFSIRTDKPNVKVSWQVTGIRQDAFANAHRIQTDVEKSPADRGHYLHPELFGAPATDRIGYIAPMSRDAKPRHTRENPLPHRVPVPAGQTAALRPVTTPMPFIPKPTPAPTSVQPAVK